MNCRPRAREKYEPGGRYSKVPVKKLPLIKSKKPKTLSLTNAQIENLRA